MGMYLGRKGHIHVCVVCVHGPALSQDASPPAAPALPCAINFSTTVSAYARKWCVCVDKYRICIFSKYVLSAARVEASEGSREEV